MGGFLLMEWEKGGRDSESEYKWSWDAGVKELCQLMKVARE